MAKQSASANGVTVALWSVVEEIDDDDEDVLEVTIDVQNDSGQDLWDLNGDIRDMNGTHADARYRPSRIESKQDGELIFWVPSDAAAWLFKLTFNTDSGSGNVELGPFTNELRLDAKPKQKRVVQTTVGSSSAIEVDTGDPFAAAFGTAMDGFGEIQTAEPALSADANSEDPMQAAFAGGLLESQQNVEPVANPTPSIAPSSPPTAPPTGPPTAPPTGPPSGPPSGPPTGPPSGPPSGPPTGPPIGAPPGPPPKSAGPPGPPPS